MDSRVLPRSSISRRAASISDFISGMRAPITVAARTACDMSSGLTRMAGGGFGPPPSGLDLRFQLRDEVTNTGRSAHRLRLVVWFDDNGGGRIASHPLKGC